MAAPVALERLADGGWHLFCGGCLKSSGSVDGATDEDAWRAFEALGWTVYLYNEWSRAYAKRATCCTEPPGQVPTRGKRRHR
jgi:hypothetical protein